MVVADDEMACELQWRMVKLLGVFMLSGVSEFCCCNPQSDGPSGIFRRGDCGTKIAIVTQRDVEFLQVRAAGA